MKTNTRILLLGVITACLSILGVARAETIVWSDNFDDGNGNNRWYADNGVWQIGTPTIGPGSAHSTPYCATTGLTANYPAGANSRLIRIQSFTVPAANQFPRVRFWSWYSMGGSDYGVVEVKGTNGVWQEVSPRYIGNSGVWTRPSVDLSAYAGQTVQLAFYLLDVPQSFDYQNPGWYVDDVALLTGTPVFNNPEGWENGLGDWYAENGVWEVGVPTSGPSPNTYNFNSVTGFGWTFGVHAGLDHNSGTFYSVSAPNTTQAAFIQNLINSPASSSSIAQSINFTATGSYSIAFANIGRAGSYGPNTIQVQVDGSVIYTLNYTSQSQAAWQTNTAIYNCTIAGSHTVSFVGVRTGGDYSSCIDNVSVTGPASVTVVNPSFETPTISGYGAQAGSYDGANCAATVLSGNYPAGANSRFISPAFVVPSANQFPRVRFWSWYSMGGSDYGVVEVKGTNGIWQEVSPRYIGNSGVWTEPSVDLSAYAGQTVQLAFYLLDVPQSFDYQNPGWYVDDVALLTGTPVFNNPEGFENGLGDWYAESGVWQVGVPTSGPGAAHTGTNCAATVLSGNYPAGANSRFISPAFVVPSANQFPRVRFWSWYSMGGSDYGVVEVKGTNGIWQEVSPRYIGNSGVWTEPSVDLSAYAGQTVQLAFYLLDVPQSFDYQNPGWYVDDVALLTGTPVFNNPEGFENGLGDWYAESGVWQVGVPTSGPGAAHTGTNCAATVLSGNYPAGANSRFISPAFVVPSVSSSPYLRFWSWYSMGGSDYGVVEVKGTNGIWQEMSPHYVGNSGAWT